MDAVSNRLRLWGYSEDVIQQFQKEEIDEESFELLDDALIADLFKTVGARAKFKKLYTEYLKQVKCLVTKETSEGEKSRPTSEFSSWSCSGSSTDTLPRKICEADTDSETESTEPDPKRTKRTESEGKPESATRSPELVVRVNPEEARKRKNALEGQLTTHSLGKALLKKRDQVLTTKEKRRLADIVITKELSLSSNNKIQSVRLEELSKDLCSIFPKEEPLLFFSPYVKTDGVRRLMSGALVNSYYQLRRQINSVEVGTGTPSDEDEPTAVESGAEVENGLAFLKHRVEPWPEVENKWHITSKIRMKSLTEVDKKTKTSQAKQNVTEYLKEYKCLRQPLGYTLLEQDFAVLYPSKQNVLHTKWTEFSEKALLALKKEPNLPFSIQTNVNELSSQKESGEKLSTAKVLLSLSGLVPLATLLKKGRKNDTPGWRPSKEEIQQGFVTHINIVGDLVHIERRHNKFLALNLTVQPFVIIVGKTLNEIESSYVVIDRHYYLVETPLTALEVAFKAHFALNLSYSLESAPLWLLEQIGLYGIRTKHDKLVYNPRSGKVLSDFGLKLEE